MPALGMAQETGLIVSWLKSPGDAVAIGDALMEVETDKAVMEVKALADGFLADLRAEAGESVPVGEVIALITDAPQAEVQDMSELSRDPAPILSTDQAPLAGNDIIMPALGMAQETGLIVAWHKAVGEAVLEDDVLLEVETDKSTMEVPAGQSGFIADILVPEGQEVPVGSVIAIISTNKPAVGAKQEKTIEAPVPDTVTERPLSKVASAQMTKAKKAEVPRQPVALRDGRILASPKARRLAMREGLDLMRLSAAGHPQPFHVADLAILRAMPKASSPMADVTAHRITACCSSTGVAEFIAKMHSLGGMDLSANMIWASFAAGAWRSAEGAEGTLIIELTELTQSLGRFENLDRQRLSQPSHYDGQQGTDLILQDLSKTAITSVSFGANLPTLTIGNETSQYFITFEYGAEQISNAAALTFVSDFAARLEDPLRHLL